MKSVFYVFLALTFTTFAFADLVGHWPLDADATDASGNGNDGTIVGGTVNFGGAGANANTGTSAAFPDEGHIAVPFAAALNPGNFSVSLWARSTNSDGFRSAITSRDDVPGTETHGFILYNASDGMWDFWTGRGTTAGAWERLRGGNVADSTWTHIAMTYDATTMTKTIFVDGFEAGTVTADELYSPNSLEALYIGSGQDDGLNFFWSGDIDDVAVWDEVLTDLELARAMTAGAANALPDPRLVLSESFEIELSGVDSFTIPVVNGGDDEVLDISAVDVSGANAATVTVTEVPGTIAPGAQGNISLDFDSLGGVGPFVVELEVDSNDPINGSPLVTLTINVRDPILVAADRLDFGTLSEGGGSTAQMLEVRNDGAANSLDISGVAVTGANGGNFSVTSFPASVAAGGGTGLIEIEFDPMGEVGAFVAQLDIASNDTESPATIVPLLANVPVGNPLVAWWPLDSNAADASGNGFDGTDDGAVTYGVAGASAATGSAANFTGGSHIDVAWDAALNTSSYTISFWANPTSGDGAYNAAVSNRDDINLGEFRHGWIVYNDNTGTWSAWNGGGEGTNGFWNLAQSGAVTLNEWHHVAVTYDRASNTKVVYVDGVAISTTEPAGFSPNNSGNGDGLTHEDEDLHIGGGGDEGNEFTWEGSIDDVGLFRTALTSEQITTIIADGVGSFAADTFQITSVTGDQQGVTIRWNSRDGQVYIVERAIGGLGALDWEELTDDTMGTGDSTEFTDTLIPAEVSKVFYRVRLP